MVAPVYNYQRPYLYPKQEAAIFCDARIAVIEASTKSGKTVGCIAWLFEQAIMGKAGQIFWWVAPVYQQAEIAYDRLCRGIPNDIYEANDTKMTVRLINGTVIKFKSGEKPNNLYGEDVTALVIDEATRMREDAFVAVFTTLTHTEGSVRIIGNVKGRRNWAWKMARRAEAGDDGMHYAKITADDAAAAVDQNGQPIMTHSAIATAKAQMPEAVFRELYYAEASDDGGNPFGMDHIQACIAPLSTKPPVVFGWDLAKHSDWTVGIGLDEDGAVCVFERWQHIPWPDTECRILEISRGVSCSIDSTGVGDPVLDHLQESAGSMMVGFKYNPTSKDQLMVGLAVAIQKGMVTFPDGTIVAELESFEYEYTRTSVLYSAPEGLHDDCVCALAQAVAAHRDAAIIPDFARAVLSDVRVSIEHGNEYRGRQGVVGSGRAWATAR